MLQTYSLTLKEIAFDCGYNDTAYFCRVFKKTCKITPTEYRTDSTSAGSPLQMATASGEVSVPADRQPRRPRFQQKLPEYNKHSISPVSRSGLIAAYYKAASFGTPCCSEAGPAAFEQAALGGR